jgi:hypothetical protein
LGAHAEDTIHLEHKSPLFLNGDEGEVFSARAGNLLLEADLVSPNLTIEICTSVFFLDEFFGDRESGFGLREVVGTLFLASLGSE